MSSRAKWFGVIAVAFACGLVFAAGFDLTRFSFAQSQTPGRTASFVPGTSGASVADLSNAFVGIAERSSPAVVSITAEREEPASLPKEHPDIQRRNAPPGLEDFFEQFGQQGPQQQPQFSSGTGFIVSAEGHVLTNNHVVDGMTKIRVGLADRREFTAKVVGRDPQTDVAVLQISGSSLPVAPLGDDGALKVGEWVIAIGNPLGLDHTVTAGIVSAKGRGALGNGIGSDRYAISDFIQTDAAINPGNSGGPLLNIKGEVIGINSAIATRTGYYQGYGFAIPINLARDVMNDLIKNGRVRRAVIGVNIGEVSPADARSAGLKEIAGAKVGGFSSEDSPARRAGLEPGDIIVKADGRAVDRVATLQRIIRAHQPGESVDLEIVRFGDRKSVRIKLSEAPAETAVVANNGLRGRPERAEAERASSFASEALGITVEEPSATFLGQAKVPQEYRKGVLVTDVERWARGNFVPGRQLLVQAVLYPRPRKDIASVDDFRTTMSKFKDGDTVSLLVYNIPTQSTTVISLTIGDQ